MKIRMSNQREKSAKVQRNAPPKSGRTVRDELDQLRKMYPRKNGLRLRNAESPKSARFATLFVLLRDENRASVHASLFEKKRSQNDDEWHEYFVRKVLKGTDKNSDDPARRLGVLAGAIIPGTNVRSNGIFHLQAVVGYALHKSIPSRLLSAWNKA